MTFIEEHWLWFVIVILAIAVGIASLVVFLAIRRKKSRDDMLVLKSVAQKALINANELMAEAMKKVEQAKQNSELEVEAAAALATADAALEKATGIAAEYKRLRNKYCPKNQIAKPAFAVTTLVINHSSEPTGFSSPSEYAAAAYEQGFKNIHIDFMDGEFSEKSASSPEEIEETIKTVKDASIDIHIMANDNKKWVKAIAKVVKKCKAWHRCYIIFHIESTPLKLANKLVKKYRCGIAIDLPTDIKTIDKKIWDKVNCAIVMTVKAGAGGQKQDKAGLEKVTWLTQTHPHIFVIADGGINQATLENSIASGADMLSLGMYGYQLIKEKKGVAKLR